MADGQITISRSGQPRAFAGMVADTGIKDDVAAFNLEASAEIPFGTGVKWDGETGALQPTASNSVLKGIIRWEADHQTGLNGDLGTTGLKPKAAMSCRRRGRMWVMVDAGYNVGDLTPGTSKGYCRFETDGGSNTVVGAWRASDDGHVVSAIGQVTFASSVILDADGVTKIAMVDCDFDNKSS
jgi:hypothetical protein